MALSIKTEEADRLARELSRLTGETMTQAVTEALRLRLAHERASPARKSGLKEKLEALSFRMSRNYPPRPLTKAEQGRIRRRYRHRMIVVIDTSALLAIAFRETSKDRVIESLDIYTDRQMSVANYVEAGTIMADRHAAGHAAGVSDLEELIRDGDITLVPVDEAQARIALEARIRFGKGISTSRQAELRRQLRLRPGQDAKCAVAVRPATTSAKRISNRPWSKPILSRKV